MAASDQPEFLTVQEASQRLKVTEQTIYNWIDAGDLKSVRVGRGVRIPRSWLNEFVGYRGESPDARLQEMVTGVSREQVATSLELISQGIQQLANAIRDQLPED